LNVDNGIMFHRNNKKSTRVKMKLCSDFATLLKKFVNLSNSFFIAKRPDI